MEDNAFSRPAKPGQAWMLSRFDKPTAALFPEPDRVDYFRDPAAALAVLAKDARDSWALLAGLPGVPTTAPADDAHAVSVYYSAGTTGKRVSTSFWLGCPWSNNPVTGPVDETVSAVRPDGSHIVVNAWGDWLCLCANTPSSAGFGFCTPEGVECEPGNGWPGTYVCFDCGRVITTSGQVLTQVDVRGLAS